jgi:hypothetical protein
MANAPRDENRVTTMMALSDANGTTIKNVPVNVANNNALKVSDALTGSDFGGLPAPRDGNYVPVLMGVSAADGITPVAIYGDATTGALLIRST